MTTVAEKVAHYARLWDGMDRDQMEDIYAAITGEDHNEVIRWLDAKYQSESVEAIKRDLFQRLLETDDEALFEMIDDLDDEGPHRIASILPSKDALQVEFPIESVKGILQDALDDDDQISLLWAAYLFGFDRSRVAGAWGTENTVELRFASTKDREAALDTFRSLTGQA